MTEMFSVDVQENEGGVVILRTHGYLNNLLGEFEYNKKMRPLEKKIGKIDSDSIFEAIEQNNPIGEDDV